MVTDRCGALDQNTNTSIAKDAAGGRSHACGFGACDAQGGLLLSALARKPSGLIHTFAELSAGLLAARCADCSAGSTDFVVPGGHQ